MCESISGLALGRFLCGYVPTTLFEGWIHALLDPTQDEGYRSVNYCKLAARGDAVSPLQIWDGVIESMLQNYRGCGLWRANIKRFDRINNLTENNWIDQNYFVAYLYK